MFETNLFADPTTLLLGALTGLIFGFLLQKGGVTRYETIVGQFLLRDFTMIKVMMTAIVVGGIGIYAMLGFGMIDGLKLKSTHLLTNALGGGLFGLGMVLLGYCPGTGVAAIGSGARDALVGVLGMLVGAALYAEAHAWIQSKLGRGGDLGKITLPALTGVSPWLYIGVLAVGTGGLFRWLQSREPEYAR